VYVLIKRDIKSSHESRSYIFTGQKIYEFCRN